MRPAVVKVALGGTLSLGLLIAVRLAAWPLVKVSRPTPTLTRHLVTTGARHLHDDSFPTTIVARDVFRLMRRPSDVAYDPLRLAEQMAPPAPKPMLRLAGIVWEGGRDPTALVEGLPSIEGVRVVRVGDVVAGLRVRSIAIDQIRIVGMDTAWVLKVREPWR